MYKVLIVEDDPMVAQINEQYISRVKGFSVAGKCRDGKSAIQFVKGGEVDLVLLDVHMPEMDGIETLRELRAQRANVDAIFLTAADDRETLVQALRLGAIDYLVKPYTFERFSMALEKYAAQCEALGELEELSQKTIDHIIENARKKGAPAHPKGIQKKTLALVLAYLRENPGHWLAGEEVARAVGLTGVTVRRYLSHLESAGQIEGEMHYGTGGRPCARYRMQK